MSLYARTLQSLIGNFISVMRQILSRMRSASCSRVCSVNFDGAEGSD